MSMPRRSKLVYTIKTQRRFLGFLFVMNFLSMSFQVEGSSEYIFYFKIVIQVLLFISLIIEYELKIEDSYLTYRISLFRINFYKKRITPKEIKRIKFVRVGWLSKGAIIQVEKGFNIRVTHFAPKTVIAELLDFAHEHDISMLKTRDFAILEK